VSYRTPSQKKISELATAQSWTDADVVIEGSDADGKEVRITRSAAKVPGSLVRRWLVVRDRDGMTKLRVVRDFISGDGFLFSVRARDQDQEPGPAAGLK
jgi:hypothetical protein